MTSPPLGVHSIGRMARRFSSVIPGAVRSLSRRARTLTLSGLVYVSALVPDAGESSAEPYQGFAATPEFVLDTHSDGFGFLSLRHFKSGFAHDVCDSNAAFMRDPAGYTLTKIGRGRDDAPAPHTFKDQRRGRSMTPAGYSAEFAEAMRNLVDQREISSQLGRFARILDAKGWERASDVFAPDVVFDYGEGGELRGIAALVTTFRRYLEVCGPTQHLLGAFICEPDGKGYATRTYVQARHAGIGSMAGAVFDSSGEYVDRWQLQDGAWRIVERRVRWLMHSCDPAVLGTRRENLG